MSEKEREKKPGNEQEPCGCGCEFSTGKETRTVKSEDKEPR